jgi:hypothetical protein
MERLGRRQRAGHDGRFPGEGGIDVHGILAALPPGIPYALEIPRATLVAQVGGKEHARLAIAAARAHLDSVAAPGREDARV